MTLPAEKEEKSEWYQMVLPGETTENEVLVF